MAKINRLYGSRRIYDGICGGFLLSAAIAVEATVILDREYSDLPNFTQH